VIYTYEEKLGAFDDMLATPTLTVEEKFWLEKLREKLVQGVFHDTWARWQVQHPPLINVILTAVYKVRAHLKSKAA
jgi:hypothetical protein